jgi:hypothetical protein
MATETLKILDATGGNVYFTLTNSAGQFQDSDNAFKVLASCTAPGKAATEFVSEGGVGQSAFRASLDLSHVNATPAIIAYTVEAYRRLGGSPAPLTDLSLGADEIRVALSSRVTSGSPGDVVPGLVVKLGMTVDGVEGDNALCWAWVEYQGQPVSLGGGDTCVFDCFEGSTDISQFMGPTTAVNPQTNGQFYCVVPAPAFLDGKEYLLTATIVLSGVTLSGQEAIPALG